MNFEGWRGGERELHAAERETLGIQSTFLVKGKCEHWPMEDACSRGPQRGRLSRLERRGRDLAQWVELSIAAECRAARLRTKDRHSMFPTERAPLDFFPLVVFSLIHWRYFQLKRLLSTLAWGRIEVFYLPSGGVCRLITSSIRVPPNIFSAEYMLL